MIVHLDADVVAYRAGFAAEHTLYHVSHMVDGKQERITFDGAKELEAWVEASGLTPIDYLVEPEVMVEPVEAALYNVRSIIRAVCDDLLIDPETELRVYLSGRTNFRDGVATIRPYKGNRDKARKPVHAADIRGYIARTYNCTTSDGQEADDDMAIAHYAMWELDPDSTLIATIDKDLDTIPGLHYNFVTKTPYYVSPEEADKFFWQQVLQGDATDNIPGLPKWGKVKASKFVAEHWPNIYPKVREEYAKAYGEKGDDALLENARLVYIRRRPDEWWTPPQEVA